MIVIPTASCGSMNSFSNRSISTSRFPGRNVYCRSSTMCENAGICYLQVEAQVRELRVAHETPRLVESERAMIRVPRGDLETYRPCPHGVGRRLLAESPPDPSLPVVVGNEQIVGNANR